MNEHTAQDWLYGTTCNPICKAQVLFENDSHIVMRHNGHSSYCGRMLGTKYCGTYASLYHKKTDQRGIGQGALKTWKGRINKRYILQDCMALDVYFESAMSRNSGGKKDE